MKCPKCKSNDTKKVYVMNKNWKPGHQICNNCNYRANWIEFVPADKLEKNE